jgi:DNA-directed RNA polymerase specialized sigma24 family protein
MEAKMSSDDAGSVSIWLQELRAGNADSARKLWGRYFEILVRVARSKLRARARRAADEEDVALSAFDSVFDGLSRGRFPDLSDREDLWRLLVTITARKATSQLRRESRKKRGGGAVLDEGALAAGAGGGVEELDQLIDLGPSPEFAALVAEEFRSRLDRLPDDSLRQIALLKLEGYTNDEIATQLGCGLRTVARKLEIIRKAWLADEVPP